MSIEQDLEDAVGQDVPSFFADYSEEEKESLRRAVALLTEAHSRMKDFGTAIRQVLRIVHREYAERFTSGLEAGKTTGQIAMEHENNCGRLEAVTFIAALLGVEGGLKIFEENLQE